MGEAQGHAEVTLTGCPTSGTLLMSVVGGGLLPALPGALIGGQFAKSEE
jgi:hypothetical protein